MRTKIISMLAGFALCALTVLVMGQATSISTPPAYPATLVLRWETNNVPLTNGTMVYLYSTNNAW